MRKLLFILVTSGVLAAVATIALVFRSDVTYLLNKEPPLATLGNQVIRETDFARYQRSVYAPDKVEAIKRNASKRKAALDRYFDSLAIAAKARHLGVDQDLRFKKAVKLMEMKLLSRFETERHRESILKNSQVLPEEVKTYYEQHKSELCEEPRFTARYLLVYVKGNPAFPEKGWKDAEARARANEALAKLRAGETWEAVTMTYSDDVSTNQKGGLIRDGQFGYFAPEVERAIKTQELKKPGEVVKSVFGYHVISVEERVTERVPKPFEDVKEIIAERLMRQRAAEARKAFMTPIWKEIGLTITEAGKRDVPLLNENAVSPNEILAKVGGKNVLESDFRWFLKDALAPKQRMSVYSRPGARQGMLSSFLDMLVLEAKSRKDGIDKTPEYRRIRILEEENLLSEFLQQKEKADPSSQSAQVEEDRGLDQRKYLDRVRAEVGLRIAPHQK